MQLIPQPDHPLIFQVNNPQFGVNTNMIMSVQNEGSPPSNIGHWQVPGHIPAYANDSSHVVNGPKIKLLSVNYQFRFHGFVNSRMIRIDFVRQKKVVQGSLWNPSDTANFLPNSSHQFQRLAGFTANKIDTKTFEVIATRRVFLDSKGASPLGTQTLENLPGGENHVPDSNATKVTMPSTGHMRYVNINLPLNRVYKQIDSSVSEVTGDDEGIHMDPHSAQFQTSSAVGSYSHTNQSPLSNVFCVISCDDNVHFGDTLSGDVVYCAMIRTCRWRDPIA